MSFRLTLPVELEGGAYRLVEEIGRGGMAIVYRAEVDLEQFDFWQLLLRAGKSRSESRKMRRSELKTVAVEAPEAVAELCRSRGIRFPEGGIAAVKLHAGSDGGERFEDEWLSLASIDHPNVIRAYGGGHDKPLDLHYYVMELIEGALSLEEVNQLSLLDKLAIMVQGCEGVRAMHRAGLIHRDIKPTNLLINREDEALRVRVSDLGVAKDIERSLELTGSRAIIGTPNYMAPEVIRSSREASQQSDIYSLGATLFFFICGAPPFQGENLYSVLTRVICGEAPRRPSELVEGVPAAVEELVMRMLSPDPASRPAGVDAVLMDLHAAIEITRSAAESPTVLLGRSPITPPVSSRAACRVLVADGDRETAALLKRFLERASYDVETAATGAEALLRAGRGDLDVIIADAQLEMLDALTLMRTLRSQGHELPILILDGGGDLHPEPAPEDGVVGFVRKPVALPELVTKLEHIRALL